MKTLLSILLLGGVLIMNAQNIEKGESKSHLQKKENSKKSNNHYNKLNEFEEFVILQKGTELAFTGKYHDYKEKGIYTCKQCGTPLYKSSDKFDSFCGWPSFDDEIKGAVRKTLDPDGFRTEISCNNCGGHLGHVFLGEGFTLKNERHCVNSVSLNFIPQKSLKNENK